MLQKASGEGSNSPPSPPQQIDGEPQTKLVSEEATTQENHDPNTPLSDNCSPRADDHVAVTLDSVAMNWSPETTSSLRRVFRSGGKPKSGFTRRPETKKSEPGKLTQDFPRARIDRRASKKKLTRERQKAREIYREALHNTRDTITLVAILISTFTYSAGISPPGGLHQDGPLMGTSIAAGRTAFRVFAVCNNVALFTSLCVVVVLVSIIPFKRKALMRVTAVAHKAVWFAVSFMAAAYVAAAAAVLRPPPRRRGMDWMTVFLVSLCGGSLGSVFLGLGISLVKHLAVKRKWRKQKGKQRARMRAREKLVEVEVFSADDDDGSSSISDMEIARDLGYHSF